MNWKMTVSGRLELKLGGIDGGDHLPALTSVEKCHNVSLKTWASGIDVFFVTSAFQCASM